MRIVHFLFPFSILTSPVFSQQGEALPTVAVLDFEARGISMVEAQSLTDRFRSSTGNTGAVRLVERSMMEKILEEQGFHQEGCTTEECVVAAGELLGVEHMMGGTIGKIGETFTVDVRMISVETGAVERSRNVTYRGEIDGLIVEVEILAYEMVGMKPPRDVLKRREISQPGISEVEVAEAAPTVAIIDFEGRGISRLEAATLTDRFRTSINNTGAVRLVERGMMEEVLQEQGFQQTGCISEECVVEVGQLLGVESMVSGSIGKVGQTYTIDARMISTETGESIRTRNINYVGRIDGLITEIEILAYEMVEMEPPRSLVRKRTLADPTIRSGKTRVGAMMRSLVFPGFGQFYAEKKLWGLGWILSEVAVAGLIYTSYTAYQSAYDDYNRFMDLYKKETDGTKIDEYRSQAEKSHDNMDTASDQIRMLTIIAGGIWVANAIHAFVVGPKRESARASRKYSFGLAYDPNTDQTQVRMTIALD